ncbi:fat-like cadherin-related tumor suppressor homolog isoform X3 [Planococcus citri]|uniref:fat-like cadherin-related tumor suppressor homolog isoform X3 n=1 Tax=Planococcus citri TaxID=170843 RepID=UPI0031F9C101
MEIRWFSATRKWQFVWIIVWLASLYGYNGAAAASTATGRISPNTLRFTKRAYNVSIPENSPSKTYVRVEEKMGIFCGDPELEVRYKIEHGNKDGFFKADERQVGDFWFLLIRTRTGNYDVLNRERKDQYALTIKATINHAKNRTFAAETKAVVHVSVLDTNDLSPLFLQTEYETTVTEDTPLYSSILNVMAEDADLGINGEIYYSFLGSNEQFSIHPTTGVISLTKPLKYTDKSLHELTVIAKDRGVVMKGTGKPNSAIVKIHVKQVNLYGPEIYVQHLPGIIEQSNADIYAIVRLQDRDSGIHGEIDKLEIVDGDPEGHFRIRPSVKDGSIKKNEYNIEVLRLLDRELAPQGYNLTLRATDKGIPQRETFKSITVQLTDLNDNAPVFDREEYEVNIPETAPINSPVVRVKVTDADEGKNAEVRLEIVGGNEGKVFRINSDTGMLYTAVQLDAEVRPYYTLTVNALDQGNVGTRKQTAAKIKINVVDTNDNDPLFDKSEDEVTVNENEPAGTVVTKVLAKDKDSGENSYISYSIANLNPVPFEIDHFAGIIKTTQVLDFESMRRKYTLKIRASDWGQPYRRQTEMQLRINLKDVNDNRPQFEKVDCVGHVPRNIPIGKEILTLSAIDFDLANYISYRIVSGNEDSCFTLDSNIGTISVTCDLNDIPGNERELNVTATDGSHFSDTARIRINLVNAKRFVEGKPIVEDRAVFDCRDTGVTKRFTELTALSEKNNLPVSIKEEFAMMPSRYGENVHTPEFISFPTEIRVNESLPLGYILTVIKGRDRDLGYNGKLIYGISSGDDDSAFRIDPDNGELKLIGYLDRERRQKYDLNVTVYDLGKPQKSVSRTFSIVVLDVNDNPPKFEKNLVNLRVLENIENGTIIHRFNATDIDEGDNAKVTYSIVYDAREFAVDPVTGVLYVAAPLDREKQSFYELILRASDGANDLMSLHSDALVRITIDDVNDNSPNFSLPRYTVRAREDIPVGTVIAILTATDPDLDLGGKVKYHIIGEEAENVFSIDSTTGTVRLRNSLDFEERQVHTMIVDARDRGSPTMSSIATLVVEVIDVNENLYAPVFDDFVVSCSVAENQPAGTFVTQVRATDADSKGDDSRIGYTIREGDGLGYFSIDNEGNIRTLTTLDAETKTSYWLMIFAQDHGVVPLHSILHVYIEIINVNDNVPLTTDPVYYPHVTEWTSAHSTVIDLVAEDKDLEKNKTITYRISGGNTDNLFSIDSVTGLIETTGRKLDRETQAEHILEVTISDNGSPSALTSTTKVVVTIDDTNDNAPVFDKPLYSFKIPETKLRELAVQQNISTESEQNSDAYSEWESFNAANITGEALFRVVAVDNDANENAVLHYSISGGRNRFSIHPHTGTVYSDWSFAAGEEYLVQIRATDGGIPSKSSSVRVNVVVMPVPDDSIHPPVIKQPDQQVDVTESDSVYFLVALVTATDEDSSHLWYKIEDGDPRAEFMIGESGNVVLAKQLNYEVQRKYNLTISVTDGVHTVFTHLFVNVASINKYRPEFIRKVFVANVSENTPVGTKILQLSATDRDSDQNLFYSLHNAQSLASLKIFNLDYQTGALSIAESLDRESIAQHILTVMVKDEGTPSKRNYARVVIDVFDANDHAPEFSVGIMQGRVFETATVGTTVVQVFAVDKDHGDNAAISYHIASGNIGNAFTIDETLGTIQVAKELDINSMHYEYLLNVKATDMGKPPLSSTLTVHIMVVMADNAPPRFTKVEVSSEMFENEPPGTVVKYLEARSTSSLMFEITDGNVDDMFEVNPSTGIVVTKRPLDYENNRVYNLSITATNMAGAKAMCYVIVHVLDRNDNAPEFVEIEYKGFISEAAPIGSLVLTADSLPLVLKARDNDSELNALLQYEIVEPTSKRMFHVVSNTGAIRTVMNLDYEVVSKVEFHVRVSDLGKPRLTSETVALVRISVIDVNDCPPVFSQNVYNATVITPTYNNIAVVQVNATDRDSKNLTKLSYAIADGNNGNTYLIVPETGLITVQDPIVGFRTSPHKLKVTVTDGLFTSECIVNVKWEKSEDSGLVFQRSIYYGVVQENQTKITTVVVVNVIGSVLNENLVFSILNPTNYFVIGKTSGVIRTTGVPFDRETQEYHQLIVQARSDDTERGNSRVAHVPVNITVLDENDNSPMFVNLPYYAVVSVDAEKGAVITRVHAVDLDKGENGEVRYELIKGHGELFRVDRKTGDVTLKQMLEGHNKEYQLIIAAYDGGMTPCSSEVTVNLKVMDKSMPIFDRQFYSMSVPEDIEIHSHLPVSIKAESPLSRKLIYSISAGNPMEQFNVDFNTAYDSGNGPCTLYVAGNLDYEKVKEYSLTARATDSLSGIFAEVLVNILVTDVNDCPPEFLQDSYNVSVSEAAPFGSFILKVAAKDNDTGVNSGIRYSIQDDIYNSIDNFHIDPEDGSIYLKRSLDHETRAYHHFTVVATDMGLPPLSSTAHVWLTVLDVNDNAPKFELSSYMGSLCEDAVRGQFIILMSASDPDEVDQDHLIYNIVGGNLLQNFALDSKTGIITLNNFQKLTESTFHTLNVSVSDGVYTSFSRVRIDIVSSNLHAPIFEKLQYEVRVSENQAPGVRVLQVRATDEDQGIYGRIGYSFVSQAISDKFHINNVTGEIMTKQMLDREESKIFEMIVLATDPGGLSGITNVRVIVTDVNDNAPQFVLNEYKSCIPSSLVINSFFLKVKAIDIDEGPNSQIEYSIYDTSSNGITELFGINRNTGGISLAKSAVAFENQAFQFFVRATDRGTPAMYADVSVEVYIMSPRDTPPVFERNDDKFFLSEDAPIGSIITKMKLVKDVKVKFKLVSSANLFSISNEGQVQLSNQLDREKSAHHVIGVLAYTDSSPPLTALSEISLQVIDMNDNLPVFENEIYTVSVAENIPEGTSILKVHASDKDEGKNGEVRYSLENSNVFSIDPFSGWITNIVSLDREIQPAYALNITASDNGNPVFKSTARVLMNLIDSNDNPSLFTQATYVTSVKEDALAGTVIIRLALSDADSEIPKNIAFYITSGNPLAQFGVRNTGEIFVLKSLDRETIDFYELNMVATDGKFVTSSKLVINIVDVNDEHPYCLKYRYHRTISEAEPTGASVLDILASDADLDPKLRFYLTGPGAESFSLDRTGGELKIARLLDREKQSRYELTAHVQDGNRTEWECISQVVITVLDVNDNAPSFITQNNTPAIPEDAEIGTLVTKVHATDADIGINRKIRYSLMDSAKGHFSISPEDGIVTLAKPLDRETKDSYNISIKAVDQGIPPLYNVTSLFILILDVNDNPPEFLTRTYYASIPESSGVGTEVARVFATSLDTGINAEVRYSIVGGNEFEKFAIDSVSGVITLSQLLDYEKVKDYLLTVQATDQGFPPLSNQATVNVTVADANDNIPTFTQMAYTSRVSEDVPVGDIVLKVTANDLDSGANSKIIYSLERGDRHQQFSVDPNTGHIIVVRPLDREMTASYSLQVKATDGGTPEMSSYALVSIEVTDVNDNPPLFLLPNYTCVVQEDKIPGWPVCQLNVSDADISPNGPPFTFDILSGDVDRSFRIDSDGTVKTTSRLKFRVQEVHEMLVRAYDNGLPPLFSETKLIIKVIEESQFAPTVLPLNIWVGSFQDRWNGGELGHVHASDQDQYDTLLYSLVESQHSLFNIDERTGVLTSVTGLDTGKYTLNVSVTDGKYSSSALVNVNVDSLDEDMLNEAVGVRLRGITPHQFILNQEKKILNSLRLMLHKDVRLISIQEAPQGHLDVLFLIKGGIEVTDMHQALQASGLTTVSFPCNCIKTQGFCKQRLTFLPDDVQIIATDAFSFVAPAHTQQMYCSCIAGYSGTRCENKIPAECSCPPEYQCILDNNISLVYKCVAPPIVATSCDKNATCPPFDASSLYAISVEQMIGIGSALVFIVFLICVIILWRRCRRTHTPVPQEDKSVAVLNSEFKRTSKINNLEVTQESIGNGPLENGTVIFI